MYVHVCTYMIGRCLCSFQSPACYRNTVKQHNLVTAYMYVHVCTCTYTCICTYNMYSTDQMQGMYKARVIYTCLHEEANALVH